MLSEAILVAIAKNESQYLLEFVIHYSRLGFQKIIIYDNESTDETPVLLEYLSLFFPVERREWLVVEGVSPQKSAYSHAISSLAGFGGWIAFFDLDELLVLTSEDSLDDVFMRAAANGASAIGVSQRVFGSNNQLKYENIPVLERFPKCCEATYAECLWVKSIYYKPRVFSIDNSHTSTSHQNEYCHPNGDQIAFPDINRFPGVASKIEFSCLQLNHYITKSKDEFLIKRERGCPFSVPSLRHVRYADMNFFLHREIPCSIEFSPSSAKEALLNRQYYERILQSSPSFKCLIDPYL